MRVCALEDDGLVGERIDCRCIGSLSAVGGQISRGNAVDRDEENRALVRRRLARVPPADGCGSGDGDEEQRDDERGQPAPGPDTARELAWLTRKRLQFSARRFELCLCPHAGRVVVQQLRVGVDRAIEKRAPGRGIGFRRGLLAVHAGDDKRRLTSAWDSDRGSADRR